MLAEEHATFGEEDPALPFMNKLSIINMHLEILYKSVLFLDPEKIGEKLEEYRRVRDVKRQQELGYKQPLPKRARLMSHIEARAPPLRERSPSMEE